MIAPSAAMRAGSIVNPRAGSSRLRAASAPATTLLRAPVRRPLSRVRSGSRHRSYRHRCLVGQIDARRWPSIERRSHLIGPRDNGGMKAHVGLALAALASVLIAELMSRKLRLPSAVLLVLVGLGYGELPGSEPQPRPSRRPHADPAAAPVLDRAAGQPARHPQEPATGRVAVDRVDARNRLRGRRARASRRARPPVRTRRLRWARRLRRRTRSHHWRSAAEPACRRS